MPVEIGQKALREHWHWLGASAVMARRRRRRPAGGQTTAAGSGRRRAPFSTDTASHTHTARSLACPLLTLSSSARSFSNGIFRSDGAPCARPLLPSSARSAGQRNQPSHRTVLARPVCLFVCVSASSFPCRFPDERTPIEATPLSATSTELGLGWAPGFGIGFTLTLLLARALLLLPPLLSHTIPFPRVH